jgi:hypothetical protein
MQRAPDTARDVIASSILSTHPFGTGPYAVTLGFAVNAVGLSVQAENTADPVLESARFQRRRRRRRRSQPLRL